jgi:hypothetical protein
LAGTRDQDAAVRAATIQEAGREMLEAGEFALVQRTCMFRAGLTADPPPSRLARRSGGAICS